MSQQLSTLLAVCPAARIAGFIFTRPVLSRLPLSCVHVVFVRLHGYPTMLMLRQFTAVPRGKDSVCAPHLGVDVGRVALTVHLHQSKAPLIDCFPATECFDIELLHLARCTPRHHAASCSRIIIYTRNGSRHPISVRNCFNWMPHAAARVAAYNSVSALEMTPCVIEHVSATDFNNLITTP